MKGLEKTMAGSSAPQFSLFNTRFEPAKPSSFVNDSSEDAKIVSTIAVDSNRAQISFRNRDVRIAEWPKGCGTNTLDFSLVDKNGYYYEVKRRTIGRNFQRFSRLPEDYASPPQQRINTSIMNKVLDHIHDYDVDSIQKRVADDSIRGCHISRIPKPVDPPPTTGLLGPGEYAVEGSLRALNQQGSILKFSTIPRSFELCQDCYDQEPKLKASRSKYRHEAAPAEASTTPVGTTSSSNQHHADRGRSSSPHHRSGSPSGRRTGSPSKSNGRAHDDEAAHLLRSNHSLSSSIVRDIKFSTMNRWRHPIYKQEKYIKTSGIKLDQDYDKVLDTRIMFNMSDASSRGDGLDGVNGTTSSVDVDADCGSKITIKTAVKLSPIRYSAAFKSKAAMGMDYPVPASGTEIGPGTFIPPSAIQVRFPDKGSFGNYPRNINFGFIANPDPPGDIKPPPPITGGKFGQAGKLAGRNVHLMNVAKKKFTKVYPEFARTLYGPDSC
jgi:hypothetical protein